MTIISILQILGALHGVLLAVFLLFSRSEARNANRYLAVLVLLFSLALLDSGFFIDAFIADENEDAFKTLIWPRGFLFGPLLYLYVRELVFPNKFVLQGKQWLHFLPALLHIILTWSLLLIDSSRLGRMALLGGDNIIEVTWVFLLGDFEDITVTLHSGVYLLLALLLLHKHRLFLQNNYSYIDKINLNWLRFIITIMCFLWLVWVCYLLIFDGDLIVSILDLCIVTLIYLMGYAGLKHPTIYSQMILSDLSNNSDQIELLKSSEKAADKYQKSPLSYDQSQLFIEALEQLMSEKKLYLDSKLSLPKLAKNFDISANYLSQIINEQKQQNFFDFINSYRIEDAKQRLLNPQKLDEKILAIAMDAGFNSKSSFYKAFRKATGLTPSQYRVRSINTVKIIPHL